MTPDSESLSKSFASCLIRLSPRRSHSFWIRASVALLAAAQLALILLLPASGVPGYSRGFAPPATGLVGLLLCAPLALSVLPAGAPGAFRIGVRALAGIGVPALLWASGGLLFDVLLLTGATGDAADFDVPGAASRIASTASLILMAGLLLGRRPAGIPISARLAPHALALGWWTAAFALPYPALKLVWYFEGKLDNGIAPAGGFPFGEIAAFAVALGGALILVRARPGRNRPWLLLAPGYAGACLLMTTGSLSAFGAAAELLGGGHGRVSEAGSQLVPGLVYFSWLLLGIGVWCCARVFHLRSARVRT